MEFRGMETLAIELLRTPEIQRLRKIRQLGLCHLVFPGAEHSRLAHCLGAAWIAVLFGRQLIDSTRGFLVPNLLPSVDSIRDLAVAALCHDIGHGPLSHAWEREIIGESYDFDGWSKKLGLSTTARHQLTGARWHELVTFAFLTWPDGQLHRFLEQGEAHSSERIAHMLRGRYYLSYLPRLLSSDVDVDRADFIRRDTYQTGVAYGRYDLEWLISTCTVGKNDTGELVLGFDARKAHRVIEQFLIARQALYDTVYYHKTVHCAEGMVGLFLRRLRDVVQEGGRVPAENMLQPYINAMKREALDQEEILRLDDFSLFVLIDAIASSAAIDATASDLGKRLLARDLFKQVPCSTAQIDDFLSQKDGYQILADVIKPFCRGNPDYYYLVDKGSFSMFHLNKAGQSYLVNPDRTAVPLKDHDGFKNHHKETSRFTRLFTLSEAVKAVSDCLTSHARH